MFPPCAMMTPSTPLAGTLISAVTECDLFFILSTEFSDRRPILPNKIWDFPLINTGRPARSELIRAPMLSSRGSTLYRTASISHRRCDSCSFSGICLASLFAWLQSLPVPRRASDGLTELLSKLRLDTLHVALAHHHPSQSRPPPRPYS